MYWILWLAALPIALLEWLAVRLGWRRVEYVAKPGVMLCLIAGLVVSSRLQGAQVFFLVGAGLSLLGDVLLLLPNERRSFILGLGAFLLAHLAYIFALNWPPAAFTWPQLGLALIVAVIAVIFGRFILGGLRRKGLRRLTLPVVVYLLALGGMLFSALNAQTRTDWANWPAALVGGGAVLFVASDTILAWNKFVRPIRNGRLILMILYHLGQGAILIGAVVD
jgi:uncharacterized membrane protein YhhN